MITLTHEQIFEEFCKWSPQYASMVVDYKPWGSTSIVVWLSNGHAYKVKCHATGRFTIQTVSKEDINRKFERNNV